MYSKISITEHIYCGLEEKISVFLVGAFLYTAMEIAFRGHSHWSMSITGGICCLSLYILYIKLPALKLWQRCLLGALIITFWEFNVGCVVNLLLGWNVWDYSMHPFNVLGQICLLFTAMWFFLSMPVSYFAGRVHHNYFKKDAAQ